MGSTSQYQSPVLLFQHIMGESPLINEVSRFQGAKTDSDRTERFSKMP